MSRSRWKGSFIDKLIYKKTLKYKIFFLKKFIKKKIYINIFSLNLYCLSFKRLSFKPIFSSFLQTKQLFYIGKVLFTLFFFLNFNKSILLSSQVNCIQLHNTLIIDKVNCIQLHNTLIIDRFLVLFEKYFLKKKIFLISKSLLRLKNILKLKFNFAYKILIKKKFLKYKSIKFWSKRSTITNNIIGKKIFIYNGKIFKPITITREMVGFKYGAFILTRKSRSSVKYKKK
jgi:ribosomal protein S19